MPRHSAPRRHRASLSLVLSVLGVATLIGCAATPSDPSWTQTPAPTGASGSPAQVISRDDLVNPYGVPISWRSTDATHLEVTFTGGPPECVGASVRVAETATTVTIDVRVGAIPGSGRCTMTGIEMVTTATLGAPLGQRKVIDANAA